VPETSSEIQIEDSIVAAIVGFVGVVVGATITGLREWFAERRLREVSGAYAAARLACALDRFFDKACEVVRDDGLSMGQYNLEGYRESQVESPTFDPEALDVDWKVLPAALQYRVLSFPNDIVYADKSIGASLDFGDGPPDFEDGFQTRRFEYAGLAIQALELAGELRANYGLQKRQIPDWNSVDFLNKNRKP
jgi:hypothetical protein